MRERLSVSSLAVLIVSCLLIAYSKRATDITAVIGYAGLVFALVLIMMGLVYRDKQSFCVGTRPRRETSFARRIP